MIQNVTVPAAGPDPNARGAAGHHPNFRGFERRELGDTYVSESWRFAPFTGNEPDPETVMPDHVQALRNADYHSPEYQAYRLILGELHAANTCWQVARWTNAAAAALREHYPTWQAYRRATAAAEAAYAALDDTEDGKWRAALLRLADARTAALDAARHLDGANEAIDALDEGLPERVTEELPSLHEIARQLSLDIDGWDIYSHGGWGGPVRDLEDKYRKQDKRITEVARLAGERADA